MAVCSGTLKCAGAGPGTGSCRPFMKWVGGKGQLLAELQARMPAGFTRYFEPFLGGGALLFSLLPCPAYVCDINPELVNAYCVVRDDVEGLMRELQKHRYEEEYFYELRNADRLAAYADWTATEKAARAIYLNKTCYNGLYRVNSKGHFNTPFGRYTRPAIVAADNLRSCSKALNGVQIVLAQFDSIEEVVQPEDFVYFDPPYVPLSATANFTGYSQAGFDREMQERLFQLCCRLHRRGIRWMASNSSAEFVIALYGEFKIDFVQATRAVNSKSDKRGKINEVIIRNY